MNISKGTVRFLAENLGQALQSVSEKHYTSAISRLEEMIRAIAKVAVPIDETAIEISYPGQDQGGLRAAQPQCQFVVRDHSISAEYTRLALAADTFRVG